MPKNEESSTLTTTSIQCTETPIQKEESKLPLPKEQEDPVKQVDTTASVKATGESLEPKAAAVQQKPEMADVDSSKMDVITAVSTNDNTLPITMERPVTEEKEEAKPSIPVAIAVAVPVTEVLVRPSSLIHEAVSTVPPEITPVPAPAAEHINDPEKVVEEEHVQPCSIPLIAEATKPLVQQVKVQQEQDQMQPGVDLRPLDLPDIVTLNGKEVAEKDKILADQQPAALDATICNVSISQFHQDKNLYSILSLSLSISE